MSSSKTQNTYLSMGLRLMIIAAAVVLLVTCVNFVTKDAIAKNTSAKIDRAISELFPDGDVSVLSYELTEKESENIAAVYAIRQDGYIVGYCFDVTTVGFSGDVSFIVGITTGSKVEGVKVISHTETPSIGAPLLTEDGILPIFNGIYTSKLSSVDSVSGATHTSNAIISAVDIAAKVADKIISANG